MILPRDEGSFSGATEPHIKLEPRHQYSTFHLRKRKTSKHVHDHEVLPPLPVLSAAQFLGLKAKISHSVPASRPRPRSSLEGAFPLTVLNWFCDCCALATRYDRNFLHCGESQEELQRLINEWLICQCLNYLVFASRCHYCLPSV